MAFILTSVPEILSKYGSVNAAVRQTGFSDSTVRKYQFDYKCESHIIVNGQLMTSSSTSARLVIEPAKDKYEIIDGEVVKVKN